MWIQTIIRTFNTTTASSQNRLTRRPDTKIKEPKILIVKSMHKLKMF
jgi:hypothetical protein